MIWNARRINMNANKALLALFTQLPKGQECGDCLTAVDRRHTHFGGDT